MSEKLIVMLEKFSSLSFILIPTQFFFATTLCVERVHFNRRNYNNIVAKQERLLFLCVWGIIVSFIMLSFITPWNNNRAKITLFCAFMRAKLA
jgi:hypothetical protein